MHFACVERKSVKGGGTRRRQGMVNVIKRERGNIQNTVTSVTGTLVICNM